MTLPAAELTVAAASNFKFALDELIVAFHANQSDIRVKATYGSSGNVYAQLQNRAPFDVFLSADMEYPRRLVDAGLALDTNVFPYAVGRIVVWVRNQSPVDVERLGIQSLLEPPVRTIAVANPRHAPYGVAAVAAMKSLNVHERVEARLVYGENIAQTAQFAQSGTADVGILALSLAVSSQMRDSGRYWEIPIDAYPRVEQGGVILKWTKEAAAARAFRDFVLGEQIGGVLKRHGYDLPAPKTAAPGKAEQR